MGGVTYFVDEENGDDSRDGLSPKTAFKSYERARYQCRARAKDIIVVLPGDQPGINLLEIGPPTFDPRGNEFYDDSVGAL